MTASPDTSAAGAPAPAMRRALGAILVYATVIAFTDNYVRVIAEDAGLWQFHATRSAMALALLGLAAIPLGLRLWPRRPGAVAARSLIHGAAMLVYFGCLAFLPVAVVAAGLFTAPLFVLLLSRLLYGRPIAPAGLVAVLTGFAGVLLVLDPAGGALSGPAAFLPVLAGALYAMGNLATREWCDGESAATLNAGFFAILGLFGLVGMAALALTGHAAPPGPDGFIARGPVAPSANFLFWTFVQAAGSLVGVGCMVHAYQIADARRVSVLEYAIIPASALWTWVLWGDVLTLRAMIGIALIILAGLAILRSDSRGT